MSVEWIPTTDPRRPDDWQSCWLYDKESKRVTEANYMEPCETTPEEKACGLPGWPEQWRFDGGPSRDFNEFSHWMPMTKPSPPEEA